MADDFIGQCPIGGRSSVAPMAMTVFAININGTGFTVLHSFTALDVATQTTNRDGAYPNAGLILLGKYFVWDGGKWRHQWLWHSVCREHGIIRVL